MILQKYARAWLARRRFQNIRRFVLNIQLTYRVQRLQKKLEDQVGIDTSRLCVHVHMCEVYTYVCKFAYSLPYAFEARTVSQTQSSPIGSVAYPRKLSLGIPCLPGVLWILGTRTVALWLWRQAFSRQLSLPAVSPLLSALATSVAEVHPMASRDTQVPPPSPPSSGHILGPWMRV